MAENSKIEWTTHTFNPWRGCTKVSPGCAHCYAETLSGRNPNTLGIWGPKGTRVVAAEAAWKEPLKWDRAAKAAGERHRVFCASLADVFEDWQGPMVDAKGRNLHLAPSGKWCAEGLGSPVTDDGWRPLTMADVRSRLFWLIHETPHLDWLLLTKRPENFGKLFNLENGPPPNVWIGVSVENQEQADKRIPLLLKTPAAVRFLSCEPLLGPVDLGRYLSRCTICGPRADRYPDGECIHAVLHSGPPLDWIICGGESGHGARPCRVEWIRSIVQQCKAAGVACFVKQLGSKPNIGPFDAEEGAFPRCPKCGHFDFGPCPDGALLCNGCDSVWRGLRDRKGGDIEEWPADLRIREFPKADERHEPHGPLCYCVECLPHPKTEEEEPADAG